MNDITPPTQAGFSRARTLLVWLILGSCAAALLRAKMNKPEAPGNHEMAHSSHGEAGMEMGTETPLQTSTPAPSTAGATATSADSNEDRPKGEPAPPSLPEGSNRDPEAPAPPNTSANTNSTLHDLHNTVCPIMEGDVEDMETGWISYNGMKIHFCCPGCWSEFSEDPVTSLQVLQDDYDVELPAGALDAGRNPPVVDLDNELSPISQQPVEFGTVAVYRGIAVHLSSVNEISAFLADADRHLKSMSAAGHPVPQDRLSR